MAPLGVKFLLILFWEPSEEEVSFSAGKTTVDGETVLFCQVIPLVENSVLWQRTQAGREQREHSVRHTCVSGGERAPLTHVGVSLNVAPLLAGDRR